MGGSKKKKQTQSTDNANTASTSNTNKPTLESIQATLNELRIERLKLADQARDLEAQCARSQALRAFLEDPDMFEGFFRESTTMPNTIHWGGPTVCCLELPPKAEAECKHELCSRAKTLGMTEMERRVALDYASRLKLEEDESKRVIIRKDRDAELARLKKEEEGDQPTKKLRTKFGNQSGSHYWAKSSSLEDDPSLTDSDGLESKASFQIRLQERLYNLTGKGDTFTKEFSIVEHFLNTKKASHLTAAAKELRGVLQLVGPMSPEVKNSLGSLEVMFYPNVSFIFPDGKHEFENSMDYMEKAKDTLKQGGKLPAGVNSNLVKFLKECVELESEAKLKMQETCVYNLVPSADLMSALVKIKNEYVAKSPIPPLTMHKLDVDVVDIFDVNDVRQLLNKATSGMTSTELEAHITSLVIMRAEKKSGLFVEKLERINFLSQMVVARDGSEMLKQAIKNVLGKMKKFKPAGEAKNQESDEKLDPRREAVKEASKSIRTHIERFGLWATFTNYSRATPIESETMMIDKADSYKETVRAMIKDEAAGVKATVLYLYKLKLCPGLAAVLISQALLDILTESPKKCNHYMNQFISCMDTLPAPVSSGWSKAYQTLVHAMTQLFVATYVETLVTFPESSPLSFAINIMACTTRLIQLTRSADGAYHNMSMLDEFLGLSFSPDMRNHGALLSQGWEHWHQFCSDDTFRCLTTTGPCAKHMRFR